MEKKDIKSVKKDLENKIQELKGLIRPDELKEVNKIYDKYIPTTKFELSRVKSYKNFLQSYVDAKYQNRKK